MEEMGLKPNAEGIRAEIKLVPMPYGENWTRLGEYLREALRRVGVRVIIENTDAPYRFSATQTGNTA